MFTYLQGKIATSGEANPVTPLPRSNESAAWDGQYWDQAKLDAALAQQQAGADGRKVASDATWMAALNPLSGITKKYGPTSTVSNDEYGQSTSAPNTGGWTDKLGRGYIGAGVDADGNQLIQYANNDSGFENPTGNNGRDRVAPTYRLNADGTATPVSAGTNYQASEWVNNGRDVAKGVATMVAAYFGGSWLAAYEAGAVTAPVAGAAATEGGASLAAGGGGVAGAAGGSGSAIGAEAGAYAGSAAGSGAATGATNAALAESAVGTAGYGASSAGAGGAAAGTAGAGTGLTAAQTAYGGVEAGGAAAGMGGNATAAGTYGTAGVSAGGGSAAGGSLINGISNQSLASGVASIGSAYMQNQATNRAIDAQTNAANGANALQLQMYNQSRADNAPWRESGVNALLRMNDEYNKGTFTNRFDGANVQNEPGYAFGMREGMKQVDNSASARGGIGGAALKAGTRYAQDYAGTKYNDAFNRWNTENTGIYNRLANSAGLGQQANALVGSSGTNYANQTSNNMTNLGNAQGAAAINQGNIYGNLLNQGAAWGNQNNWWQGKTMAIDAGIYQQNPLRSVADYEGDYQKQALTKQAIQQNALALQTGQMGLQDRQRAIDEQGVVRNALMGLGPNANDTQRINALKSTGTQTGFAAADALEKALTAREKEGAATAKTKVETQGLTDKQKRDAIQFNLQSLSAVNNPQQYASWLDGGVKSGLMTQQEADAQKAQIPNTPQEFAQLKQQQMMAGVDLAKQFEIKAAAARDAESGRHNTATEKNAAGQLAVAQGNLGVSRERLAAERAAPKGVIYDGNDGPMLVDPRAGTAVPITAGGAAIGPKTGKLKDIPAAVNSKIIEGKQGLSNIDSAIKAIEANPNAFGFSNNIPGMQSVRQLSDSPEEIAARAQVANIGSLKLHDRSGAAVSASEFPRLAPFIPSAGDTPKAAVSKLKEMKRIAEEELGLFSEVYNSDNGYKSSSLLKPKTDAPSTGAKKVVRTGTSNGRKVVQYSDGTTDYAD